MSTASAPVAARRLLAGVGALAAGLVAFLVVVDGSPPSWVAVLALTAAVAAGEAARVDLPYRHGGIAIFTLGHASLAAGLLILPASTVVLATTAGIVAWQIIERVPRVKFAFNVFHYLAGSTVAALTVHVLSPRPGAVDARTLGATALGLSLCMVVNTVAVSGMIASYGGRSWGTTLRQMTQTSVILTGGSVAMGLLAVLLATDHLWALPTIAVPLGLLHIASRIEVRAQADRERAVVYAQVQQGLAEATDSEQVHILLSEGVRSILGCSAAVWDGERWVTPVPAGSGPCPVAITSTSMVVRKGGGLGIATDGPCVAASVGNGVLVAWSGELPLREASHEWIDRLGSSGRVHGARSEASAALRRERATLRAVVHGTADGIFVMDAGGTVVLCNPAMADLAQVNSNDVAGRSAAEVFGDGPWSQEGVRDVTRPDDRVWRISVSSIVDRAHGDLLVAVVHDVTQERRVARMKDDMLSVVSHELRTPLTPIKGSAQLLRRRWDRMPAEQREDMLHTIEQRADHLARLVEDLLLVGQMSSSKRAHVRVETAVIDIVELARTATAQLDAEHPDHHVVLSAPQTMRLVTDPVRLRQIIDNLVNNACKFSPPESFVQVAMTTSDKWAYLRVIDHGRGIPPEDLERVFERFERVEDPLNMTTSGAGLGLYIVRSLAKGLGGDVKISSVLGSGTTVTVKLPLPVAQDIVSGNGHTASRAAS